MTTPIRAVYEDGKLRPLQPVDLAEGQEIELVILTERARAIAALGDLLVQVADAANEEDIDEEALLKEIDEAYKGPPISEAIIEERREGP